MKTKTGTTLLVNANIIIFLNSSLSLAHKTDSAKQVVVNNPYAFAQNIMT